MSAPSNAQQGADGPKSHFQGNTNGPIPDAPVSMSTAVDSHQEAPPLPMPLMSFTSPLKQQSAPSKSHHSTRAATAAAATAATREQGQEAAKQTYVERWTCDVCKTRSFETFEEAAAHEISCKIEYDAMKEECEKGTRQTAQLPEAPPKRKKKKTQEEEKLQSALNNLVLTAAASSSNDQPMTIGGTSRHPNLALVPSAERSNVLSQYNNLLVRHVEFFYPATSHLDYDNLSERIDEWVPHVEKSFGPAMYSLQRQSEPYHSRGILSPYNRLYCIGSWDNWYPSLWMGQVSLCKA